jgi:methylamine---glutamate N-methyltransferase subunit B
MADPLNGRSGRYDARGLVEPDAGAPRSARIADGHATVDAGDLSVRQLNLELRRLLYEEGIHDVTVSDPGAKHSLGVGILARCRLRFEGSLGYYGCGLIDGPEVHITGRVGWAVAENMMSGVVLIDKNAGSLAGAALRGGDLVIRGDVGARTGIDMKGGTILVGGDAGAMTGFMMQRGRLIVCGNVGPHLGDSMYDGALYVGGEIASLGVDCVPAELDDADEEMLDRKFALYGIERPPRLRKFVCGKRLWNYDTLEPSERKLIL